MVDIERSELDKLPSRFLKFCADLRDVSEDLRSSYCPHTLNLISLIGGSKLKN